MLQLAAHPLPPLLALHLHLQKQPCMKPMVEKQKRRRRMGQKKAGGRKDREEDKSSMKATQQEGKGT